MIEFSVAGAFIFTSFFEWRWDIKTLNDYLEACESRYHACIQRLDTDFKVNAVSASLRFKYVRFDGNGRPKFTTLAEVLADHLTQFSFSVQRRRNPQSIADYNRLRREAKDLLRHYATSGESGEILLYYLIESVLKAPQLVAKMDLKTNPSLEVNGSDGIHFRWDDSDQLLDIYFGESKLEKDISSAIDSALDSISKFHKNRLDEHELRMVTGHFKWADEKLKAEVLRYIDKHDPAADCRYNHACLLGFSWSQYKQLNTVKRNLFIQNFEEIYKKKAVKISELINDKFKGFKLIHLRFEIFVLPFDDVQSFRDEFIRVTS